MADVLSYAYAADIVKSERDEAGDLLVYGKATGPDLDLDEQVCDPDWLKKAMPEWFQFANLREMHQPIAAGIGIELGSEADGWWLKSKVVDPGTALKVEKNVLKGYSIGIKNPKVIRDDTAPGGRVTGGTIVEVSYVDRPCNPSAKMAICKTVGVGEVLFPVEADPVPDTGQVVMPTPLDLAARLSKAADDLAEHPEVSDPVPTGGTPPVPVTPPVDPTPAPDPATPPTPAPPVPETPVTPAVDNTARGALADIVDERGKAALPPLKQGGPPRYPITNIASLKDAIQAFGRAKDGDKAKVKAHIKAEAARLGASNLIPDEWKALLVKAATGVDDPGMTHDPAALKLILGGLADCMKAEIDELCAGEDEIGDISQLLRSVAIFTSWWAGEALDGETTPPFTTSTPSYLGLGAAPTETKAPMTEQTAPVVMDDARLTELVKSAVTAALAPSEDRLKAMEADLVKALALPEPGGPVITRTATQAALAREVDTLGIHAAITELMNKAGAAADPVLRRGYTERAEALKLKVA